MLLLSVLRAMRNAEGAGIGAVAAGISEANVAILVTLYLAIFVGGAGVVIGLVRLFTTTTTASPSAWYYLIAGILGLTPMFALWRAQSLLLDAIFPHSTGAGVSEVAGQITLFSIVATVLGVREYPDSAGQLVCASAGDTAREKEVGSFDYAARDGDRDYRDDCRLSPADGVVV